MLNIDDRLIKEVSPKIGANALSVLLAIAIHLNQKTNRCFPSHDTLMRLTGLGRDAVYSALSKLKTEGLLKSEQGINSDKKTFSRRIFRVSTRFIQVFIYAEDAEPLTENPYTGEPEAAEPYTANPETYLIKNTKQINKNKQINKSKEKEAPQAAVTTFTPNQISETAVTVVDHEVFTLEAGFQENTPIPAGPLKENPASQDAGAFEANPVPPNLSTPKPNSRKQSARPGPESEITDPAILEFYQSIKADWAEWVDYKRREKKGNYKTAKTEAVAIGGLYRKVGGSPDKAREAIQHSIENTYAGIFPPKPDYSKPTARRYSPEDRPANPVTGNDLLAEISQFYHANAGLWRQSLKEGNAEKWVQEKQVGAVKAFCLHQVSTGRATDTFAQLNARLQAWFTKENSIQAASIAGAPSTVHQAPARVSAPVRYQETE